MNKRRKIIIVGGSVLALAAGGAGVAVATGGSDDENSAPIQGAELSKAEAAALDSVGQGRVTETEKGDEESLYEVEVTKDDGSQVDVQLDADFNVVGSKTDSESEGGDSGDE
jgi:uncharacterized membrane protein YkoI